MKIKHLKKNYEFLKVYRSGRSVAQKYLVMYYIKNEVKCNRIGVSISKKVGKSVTRHRIRRLIMESFRLQDLKLEKGFDFVFVARKPAAKAGFREVSNDIEVLIKKAYF